MKDIEVALMDVCLEAAGLLGRRINLKYWGWVGFDADVSVRVMDNTFLRTF